MSDELPWADSPDKEQIETMTNEAIVLASEGQNPYPGMTYVEGVRDALQWVTGEREEVPLEIGQF